MYLAARQDDHLMVALLVDAGAELDVPINDSGTTLIMAVIERDSARYTLHVVIFLSYCKRTQIPYIF